MTNVYPSDEVMRYEFLKLILANPQTRITDLDSKELSGKVDALIRIVKGEGTA
ncbi:MAG: hypothetical protein LBO80_07205 [Treponema sp.]|jgi:hypothetical protein|nr:hypothetical protein [Treponema sp.]